MKIVYKTGFFIDVKNLFNAPLIKFDKSWFLIDIDFHKPGVMEDLSLEFNLFLEILLEIHKCQVKK